LVENHCRTDQTMSIIYHLTNLSRWGQAQEKGFYTPEGYEKEGFIHLCLSDQLEHVWTSYYKNQPDLVVLCVETRLVKGILRFENTTGGETLFPHIYGELNLDAVQSVVAFPSSPDGKYHPPAGI
jgi:uncharacterized protein (DUF952 family)